MQSTGVPVLLLLYSFKDITFSKRKSTPMVMACLATGSFHELSGASATTGDTGFRAELLSSVPGFFGARDVVIV